MKKIVILLFCFLTISCNNDDDNGIACTYEYRPAVRVTVTNAQTGTILTQGVVVLAVSGIVSVTLPQTGDSFSGTPTSESYTISVSKEGYETYTSEEQTTESNECGIITNTMSVLLVPLE